MNKKNKLTKRLKEAGDTAHKLLMLSIEIENIEKVIDALKSSDHFQFNMGEEIIVYIKPPYETEEQKIINNCKDELLRFYINQKRRLMYKATKI